MVPEKMVNVLFYKEKIKELNEHLHEAVILVCEQSYGIEKKVDTLVPHDVAAAMDNLAHAAKLVSAFANSIYYLSRLLRDKTQA